MTRKPRNFHLRSIAEAAEMFIFINNVWRLCVDNCDERHGLDMAIPAYYSPDVGVSGASMDARAAPSSVAKSPAIFLCRSSDHKFLWRR